MQGSPTYANRVGGLSAGAAPPAAAPAAPLQSLADNFGPVAWSMNKLLNVVSFANGVLGAWPLKTISSALNKATGHMVPEWNPYMPKVRWGALA